MSNDVVISIPLFVFMGYLVERANLIEKLFKSLHLAMAKVPGSLAVATVITSAIFATATGIVGAVVTLMGLLALLAMLKAGYNTKLAARAITAGAFFPAGDADHGRARVHRLWSGNTDRSRDDGLHGWLVFGGCIPTAERNRRPGIGLSHRQNQRMVCWLFVGSSIFSAAFALLGALNLQTAFLSPPVAMAAFYLKGVSPPHVTLNQIFLGMMPFMAIQVVALALLYIFPAIGMWLPSVLYK